jgi:acetoacetate decarboxylase
MAAISLEQCGDVFVGTCVRNGIEIMQITTRTLAPAKPEEFIPVFPIYNLKMIPSVDRPEPAIKQVTCTGVDDAKTHWLYRCAGSVRFAPTAAGDFWKLSPREVIGASRTAMDYEQGYGQVVYDYLDGS